MDIIILNMPKPHHNGGGAGEDKYQGALLNEEFARELMKKPEYLNYVQHHGYHFSDKLADWATRQMENANGEVHNWTTQQVTAAIESMRQRVKPYVTNGDLAYAANMCYADIYPDIAKTESDCLKYAIKQGSDPDGYDGMIFNRFISDVIGKQLNVNWGEVI